LPVALPRLVNARRKESNKSGCLTLGTRFVTRFAAGRFFMIPLSPDLKSLTSQSRHYRIV